MSSDPSYFIPAGSTVLVSGATGYQGSHIVHAALKAGYRVKAMVRSQAKAEALINSVPQQHRNHLSTVTVKDSDLTDTTAMTALMKDVDAAIHAALHTVAFFTCETAAELEAQALKPTMNAVIAVLTAAAANPRVRRVVLTGSAASAVDCGKGFEPFDKTYTEADMNPVPETDGRSEDRFAVYRVAKKFSEVQAWEWMKAHPEVTFDLVHIFPSVLIGPVAIRVDSLTQLPGWHQMVVYPLISGQLPAVPSPVFAVEVDVRDSAEAHVKALQVKAAGGQRILAHAAQLDWHRLCEACHDLPGVKLPPYEKEHTYKSYSMDGTLATRLLGLKYRPERETYRDMGQELSERFLAGQTPSQ